MLSKIILIIFICASIYGQESKPLTNLNCKVVGLVISGNNYYLNTDNGLIRINNETDDPFEKYYREIYNDSTIVNPNTIIKPSDSNPVFNFFNPAIDISQWADQYNTFGNKLYLYDFMQMDEDGNYIFKPGIIGLIQKELKNK